MQFQFFKLPSDVRMKIHSINNKAKFDRMELDVEFNKILIMREFH